MEFYYFRSSPVLLVAWLWLGYCCCCCCQSVNEWICLEPVFLPGEETVTETQGTLKEEEEEVQWLTERKTVVDRIGIHVCLDHPHLQLGTCIFTGHRYIHICVSSWGWLFYFYWGFFKTTTEDDAALIIIYLQLPLLLFLLLDTTQSTTVFLPRITRTWAGIHSVSMAWWHMHCGVDIILKVWMEYQTVPHSPALMCSAESSSL